MQLFILNAKLTNYWHITIMATIGLFCNFESITIMVGLFYKFSMYVRTYKYIMLGLILNLWRRKSTPFFFLIFISFLISFSLSRGFISFTYHYLIHVTCDTLPSNNIVRSQLVLALFIFILCLVWFGGCLVGLGTVFGYF